ncbi:MAG: hypothetical protein HXY24_13225 [Rubrivivax sp.]|nr:hypothetical protein [Rubrivivax sp.]
MAAGILKELLKSDGREDVRVDSAGTFGCEGEPAAPLAIRVCLEDGIDISDHIAKKVEKNLIRESNLIVVMEEIHYREVLRICPEVEDKTLLLATCNGEGNSPSIRDPFGSGLREYRECYERIKKYVETLYERVIKAKC